MQQLIDLRSKQFHVFLASLSELEHLLNAEKQESSEQIENNKIPSGIFTLIFFNSIKFLLLQFLFFLLLLL